MKPENMTILTVDDTPANIRLLTHYLEKQGYKVLTAEDGFEGFKAAIQYKPDLVLLDVMMPGTDGYEVCELLKAEETTKDIPIVFLTAKNDVEDRLHGFELGAKDYITKPFNLSEISTRIKTQLELKYLQAQNKRLSQLLFQNQRAAGAGFIGQNISKHLKSLLDMLHSRLKRIQEKSDPGSPVQQAASIALELENRIKLFTETWDRFAEFRTESVEMFDTVQLIIDVIEIVESNNSELEISYDVPESPLYIKTQRSLIQNTLITLLVNIASIVRYQGSLGIMANMSQLPKRLEERAGEEIASEYLHVSVLCKCKWTKKDIPQPELDQFYVSEKYPDFALGLTTAEAFVSQCNGVLDVELSDNQGVEISAYFPAEFVES